MPRAPRARCGLWPRHQHAILQRVRISGRRYQRALYPRRTPAAQAGFPSGGCAQLRRRSQRPLRLRVGQQLSASLEQRRCIGNSDAHAIVADRRWSLPYAGVSDAQRQIISPSPGAVGSRQIRALGGRMAIDLRQDFSACGGRVLSRDRTGNDFVEYGLFQRQAEVMTAQRTPPLAEIHPTGKTRGVETRTPETQSRAIEYLCEPMPVNMGDWWFDIATENHFWIRRRFEVMRRLADSAIRKAANCAEIGCGNGLLQKAVEDFYGIPVPGFELNKVALQKNVSCSSPLYCYNIHQRNAEFRNYFDVLFMFDVLEHIEDESAFLQSVKFHLADSGSLIINVPAHEFVFSDYDRAAGHLLRKMVSLRPENGKAGFDPGSRTMNSLLSYVARCEPIPQTLLGTSVMAVLEKAS